MSFASPASTLSSLSTPTSESTPTTEVSSDSNQHTHSETTAMIAGTVGGVCGLVALFLLAVFYWRRRRRRLLREQQIAIRRMTIIGPPPPSLPYPFTGRGQELGVFGSKGNSVAGDIEMSASKGFAKSGDKEAGLPWTNLSAPAKYHRHDRVGSERDRRVLPSAATDSAIVFSSKQSDIGDGDRMAFVDGAYVVALDRDNGQYNIEKKSNPARLPRDPR